MKRIILVAALVVLALALSACGGAQANLPDLIKPTVTLERVEVASYFAWPAPPPTPTPAAFPAFAVPLVLDYVFTANNPNPYNVSLDALKFTAELEGAPNLYFPVNTPLLKDRITVPANGKQPVRLTIVLDSSIVRTNLLVTSGQKMADNKLNAGGLVEGWWKDIGDFKFHARASQGTADFSSVRGNATVTFEGSFPK